MNSGQARRAAVIACLIFSSQVWAQNTVPQTFTNASSANLQITLPSPLNAAFGTDMRMSDENPEVVTRKVNIGPSVASYAKIKQVDLQQARFDALEYLHASIGQPRQAQPFAPKVQFKPIGADRYEVTAPTHYFDRLPVMIRSFEIGKKSIVISIECLKLDDTMQHAVRQFLDPESISHVSGQVPQVPELAPDDFGNDQTYQVATTLQVSKSMPLTIGQLDAEGYEKLMKLVGSSKNSEVKTRPSVVCHPGEDALIQDGAQRPFIVGVKEVKGEFAKAHQPIVQTIEDGDYFKVACDIVGEDVRVRCAMGFAEVTKVDTIELEKHASGGSISVQSPSQLVRSININATLSQDTILFVDPYHTTISDSATSGNKRTFRKHNVVALIRTKIIDDESK